MNESPAAMKGAIGIDIGGTKIAFGAVSPAGGIVARRAVATLAEESINQWGQSRLIFSGPINFSARNQ
jgi:hypothetical protein